MFVHFCIVLSFLLKELARQLELANSTVAMYESGLRQPDIHGLEKIADLFGVSVDCLLSNSDIEMNVLQVYLRKYQSSFT